MYILELNHITKKFISVKALDRVKLNLKKGEIVAVCGENGAGKSTLMKIISGSDPFGGYEGQILMDGEEKRFHSTRDAEKSGIEMIYQEISLHLDLSVAENLFMGKLLRGRFGTINWKKMNADAKEALALVGLEQIEPTQKVKTLSTSQQQLLSIARAILKNSACPRTGRTHLRPRPGAGRRGAGSHACRGKDRYHNDRCHPRDQLRQRRGRPRDLHGRRCHRRAGQTEGSHRKSEG